MKTELAPESLSDWNKYLAEEYRRELCLRLPPDKVNDPKARRVAMKEYVDWHKKQIANFMGGPQNATTVKRTVKAALKPILSVVSCFI